MHRTARSRLLQLTLGLSLVVPVVGCGGSNNADGTGGSASTGSGGVKGGSGGATNAGSGGTSSSSGGSNGSGGAVVPGTGGSGSGGAPSGSGGTSSGTGGAVVGSGGAAGGSTAAGGGGGKAQGGAGGFQAAGGRGGNGAPGTGGATGVGGGPGTGPTKSAGCGATTWPTSKSGYTLNVGGTTRNYILKLPDNYDTNKAYRLIFSIHWLGGTAANVANGNIWATKTPYYGLWNLSGGSTIFVAPNGLGSGDSTGWPNTGGQDIEFFKAMLTELESKLCIDTTRIFAEGFSYGGAMSYSLACSLSNVFRGVAVHAGAQLSGCANGGTAVAYMGLHGTADATLNISRGRELRDAFVKKNGCTSQTMGINPTAHCVSYQGCTAGYPVEWCEQNGGDHNGTWENANQTWVPSAVWSFISQF